MWSEQDWLESARAAALQGDSATTEVILARALAAYPRSLELRRSLAGVYHQENRSEQAEKLLRELLTQHPEDIASAFLLARMLKKEGRYAAASTAITNVFRHHTCNIELVIQAIELLSDCGRNRAAAVIAEEAIITTPGDPRLHAYAGMLQIQLGEFACARQHYLFALSQSSQACEWNAPHGLASSQRYENKSHPDFDLFRQCLERPDLSEGARASLLFALGKAHDDIGDYPSAAQYFRHANALAHALTRWSRKSWRRSVEVRFATPPYPCSAEALPDFVPVFIVGMPRSGTTLTAELLSRLPGVCNRGELPLIANLAQKVGLGDNPDRLALKSAAVTYMLHARQDDPCSAQWFLDKHPLNFRYVDLILSLFPNAKIIYCKRSTRDVALSLWVQSFAEEAQGYAYDFDNIAVVMRDCARLMAYWLDRYSASIRVLNYEQLVSEPSRSIAELADWLEMPDHDIHGNATGKAPAGISTASLWQARQPVYTRSIARWKNYAAWLPELMKFPDDGWPAAPEINQSNSPSAAASVRGSAIPVRNIPDRSAND